MTSRFAGWLARRVLRKQLQLVRKFLDALAANGEIHVWPLSLKTYLRDRIVDLSLAASLRKIRLGDYVVATVVGLLLAVPAIVLKVAH
jgi:hypothetical protein